MPGSPSRDTFNAAKEYDGVLFADGASRRLFDAELNESQRILQYQLRRLASALMGSPYSLDDTTNKTGYRLDASGSCAPSGNSFTVLFTHGYFVVGGYIVRT